MSCEPSENSVTAEGATLWSRLRLALRRRWLETTLVFLVFALQGAWPVPDVNEPYYLGKAAHYWNPDWAPRDDFLQSRDAHLVFYFTFGWLTAAGLPLPAFAWAGRLITWWLLAWGWCRLSRAVIPKPGAALFSGALFACCLDWGPMAGEWVIGGVEAKCVAYAFVFFGLAELHAGRWNRVWLWLGAASAFHVLVGGWSVLAAMFAWLVAPSPRASFRSMLPWLMLGGILSLPGLLPSLALTRGADPEIVHLANRIYTYGRLAHHLVPGAFPWNWVVCFLAMTAFWAGMEYFLRDRHPSGIRGFVLGALLIATMGWLISLAIPWAPDRCAALLRYYWFRLADTAVPLGTALTASVIVFRHRLSGVHDRIFRRVLAVVVVLHVGMYVVLRPIPTVPRAETASPYLLDAQKRARITYRYVMWRRVCNWIADPRNTPPEARFLTPRMATTFKWYTGRSEVANWKEIPQDAPSVVAWWNKLRDIYAIEDPVYGLRWCGSLSELGEDRLIELCHRYDCDYIVTTRYQPLDLETVFFEPGNPYIVYLPRRTAVPRRSGRPPLPLGPELP